MNILLTNEAKLTPAIHAVFERFQSTLCLYPLADYSLQLQTQKGKHTQNLIVILEPCKNKTEVEKNIGFVAECINAYFLAKLLPKRVVIVMTDAEGLFNEAAVQGIKTLTGYLSAYLTASASLINFVCYPNSSLGRARAANAIFALTSGCVDILHGQTLRISEL